MKMEKHLHNTYIYVADTGKCIELDGITKIEFATEQPDDRSYIPNISETMECTFRVSIQPKCKLQLFGITNNCIRLHGGRPMRTINRRFL